MNDEDDYYDGDMSDREYSRRVERDRLIEIQRAREREQYRRRQSESRVRYSPSEDEDSGSMW